ncbi:(-)-germacrene D synthase, partial [Mucuna pruriens]
MSLPASTFASTQDAVSDLRRPCASFASTIWGDTFLQYVSDESMEVNHDVKQQAQILKEELKMMFKSSNQNIMQKLNFIDSVQRLGISYHFQKEIDQALEQIYNKFTKNNNIIGEYGSHYFFALLFRLLRQQGYHISSSVFNKLKNDQGNFKETLANDIQGLCILFEATHLRTHEDDILQEACDFSNTLLKSLTNQLSSSLIAQINHCLRQPLNKSVSRFEARYHMNPSHNKTLLTFAKVDFNILQKIYQKEISNITKWWKISNFETKVPYGRDRLVEAYLWSLAMYYKPKYNNERIFMGKLISVVCLLDDIYDVYGTVQELELFTEAIQRWNITPIESLPQCMKEVFDIVVELCDEIELATTDSGKSSFEIPRFKQVVFNLIKGYMVEAKWCNEEFTTKNIFDWIFNDPNIIKVVSVIGRFEQQRVHVASGMKCCMKQYGILEAEAYILIQNDVEDGWKVINEEYLKLKDIPKFVLDCVVNLARMSEISYEIHQDKFINRELLKPYVSSLLLEPMCLDQQE